MVKKPLLLEELQQEESVDRVIIESLEQALYRLVVFIGDDAYYIKETPDKPLTRRSVVAIQELLSGISIGEMYLQHQSPYDEMIGQEINPETNELIVPIGNYLNNSDQVMH